MGRGLVADGAEHGVSGDGEHPELAAARAEAATARALLELATALAGGLDPQDTARRLVPAVCRVVPSDLASVHLYDHASDELRPAAFAGFSPDVSQRLAGLTIRRTDTPLFGRMLREPSPLHFDQDDEDPFVRRVLELVEATELVVVPIISGGECLGVVTAGLRDGSPRFDAGGDLLPRLRGLADQSATAIRNAQLVAQVHHQALHDGLTDLPNRRLLLDRLSQAIVRAQRVGGVLSVLFIDLDDFKVVNDTYGHGCGDEVLVQVADRLGETLRTSDTVARLGGDEFVVVLADTDEAAAAAVASKVLEAFEAPFAVGSHAVTLTCSIGIVTVSLSDGDAGRLVDRADAAMYRAKALGKGTFALEGRAAAGELAG